MEEQKARAAGRTPEEVAWEEEFADGRRSSLGSDLRDLLVFAARLPGALIQVPLSMVPEETTRHARAAALESFLAVRSLLSAIGDNIESMLAGTDTGPGRPPTVQGPEGTWGTGRAAARSPSPGAASTGKVKRIEVGDSDSIEPATGPGDMP
jgi:hypothetical protein